MELKELGQIIKERRKHLRITQIHLAEMAGITDRTLQKIENGNANPTIKLLDQITNILGLEIKLEVKK
ncbi:MAG: helix-turn-helix domain-containing protein [Bacteroidetes bacterium]|nr:helix-turn-helix domain-containing protein [Bacteroidota bacterium]